MTAFGTMALVEGKKSGIIVKKIGRKNTVVIGLSLAFLADILLVVLGSVLPVVVIASQIEQNGRRFYNYLL